MLKSKKTTVGYALMFGLLLSASAQGILHPEVAPPAAATATNDQHFLAAKLACFTALLGTLKSHFGQVCTSVSEKMAETLSGVGLNKEFKGLYLHTWVTGVASVLGLTLFAKKKEQTDDESKLHSGKLADDPAVLKDMVLKTMLKEYDEKTALYKSALVNNTKGINLGALKTYLEHLKQDIITLYHSRQSFWERLVGLLRAFCPYCYGESTPAPAETTE